MRRECYGGGRMKMNDIDMDLQRLGRDAVPLRLNALEDNVLGKVANHSFAHSGAPMMVRVGAVAGALLMGAVGGLMPTETAKAEPSLAPLAGGSELAPATLLLGNS